MLGNRLNWSFNFIMGDILIFLWVFSKEYGFKLERARLVSAMYWLSAEHIVGKFYRGVRRLDFVRAKYVCIFYFERLVSLMIYFYESYARPIFAGMRGCFYSFEPPFRFDLVLINLFLARMNLSSGSVLLLPKLDWSPLILICRVEAMNSA